MYGISGCQPLSFKTEVMAVHTCITGIQEIEAEMKEGQGHPQLLRIQGQPGLCKTNSKNNEQGTGEVAQWVRALAVPKDSGLIPSINMVVHRHL